MKLHRSIIAFSLSLSLAASIALAAPAPVLTASSHPWLTRGQTTKVTLTGDHLAQASRIIVDGPPGIAAQLVPTDKPNPKSITLEIAIDATAPLGERELRLVTPGGVTNKIDLNITFLPVLMEKESNNTLEAAQAIALPATLHGVINGGADVDAFRFTAAKGQRLVFETFAQRGGSPLDTTLKLYDPQGREIARSEDAIGTDSLIAYEITHDGEHVLMVHDVQYRGGGNYTYRINAGQIAYAQAVFPLGGKRGTTVSAKLIGWNLPAATMQIDLSKKPVGRTTIFATPDGAANPLGFEVSDLDEFIEVEPNNAIAQASVIPSLPVVVNGVIDKPGDQDVYRFKVEKPVKLRFAVDAVGLGSMLDALLTVHDAKGGILARSPAAAPGSDAVLERDFTPGEYHIAVADLTGNGGVNFGYRLSIAPPQPVAPDFSVRFFPDTIRLHRGGRTLVQCEVIRTGGFKEAVTIALKDAPPGVVAKPLTLENGPVSGLFIIEAAADADLSVASLRLTATGKQGEQTIEHVATPLARIEPVKAAYLSVHNPAPFVIDQPKPLTDEEADQVRKEIETIQAQQASLSPKPDQAADEKNKAALAQVNERIAALKKRLGVREELAQLREKLKTHTPELAAAQAEWEKIATADTWSAIEFGEMKSVGGARFTRQKDGAILVGAANLPKDTYTLSATINPKAITALRLEALADKALPAGGPGRAENGNFVLTQFNITIAPASDPAKQQKVELHSPKATFEQDGWPIANTLDGNDSTGWAISPQFGQNHTAMFMVKPIAGIDGDAILIITMRNESPHVQHNMGKFRISTTTTAKPDIAQPSLPAPILKLLAVAPDKRNKKQQEELATYYRATAPQLEADRVRLAALEATTSPGDPTMKYNETATVAFEIRRAAGFTGDITVTALGFATGRDPQGNPNAIAKDIEVKPIVLKGDQSIGTLSLKAKDKAQVGTRTIVLQAQAVVDGDSITQISETIPVTVTAK